MTLNGDIDKTDLIYPSIFLDFYRDCSIIHAIEKANHFSYDTFRINLYLILKRERFCLYIMEIRDILKERLLCHGLLM